MGKVANVRLLGLEPSGSERIFIRIVADAPADIQAALDTAEETAARLGSTVTTTLLKTVLASRITTADGVNPEWR